MIQYSKRIASPLIAKSHIAQVCRKRGGVCTEVEGGERVRKKREGLKIYIIIYQILSCGISFSILAVSDHSLIFRKRRGEAGGAVYGKHGQYEQWELFFGIMF